MQCYRVINIILVVVVYFSSIVCEMGWFDIGFRGKERKVFD